MVQTAAGGMCPDTAAGSAGKQHVQEQVCWRCLSAHFFLLLFSRHSSLLLLRMPSLGLHAIVFLTAAQGNYLPENGAMYPESCTWPLLFGRQLLCVAAVDRHRVTACWWCSTARAYTHPRPSHTNIHAFMGFFFSSGDHPEKVHTPTACPRSCVTLPVVEFS